MRLGRFKKEILDRRMVGYDPDVILESEEHTLTLVCPIHGPYECSSKYIRQRYTKRTMRAPQCQRCREDKLDDEDYLYAANKKLLAYRRGGTYAATEELHPEWHPHDHWNLVNLVKSIG